MTLTNLKSRIRQLWQKLQAYWMPKSEPKKISQKEFAERWAAWYDRHYGRH